MMYQEHILDHYKAPRNSGKLDNCDIHFHDSNPLCGDLIDWYVNIEKGKIKEIKFESSGCAISQAASSMLAEISEGKTVKEILKMKNEEMLETLGIELSILRIKCGLLGLKALQKGLILNEAKNETEN